MRKRGQRGPGQGLRTLTRLLLSQSRQPRVVIETGEFHFESQGRGGGAFAGRGSAARDLDDFDQAGAFVDQHVHAALGMHDLDVDLDGLSMKASHLLLRIQVGGEGPSRCCFTFDAQPPGDHHGDLDEEKVLGTPGLLEQGTALALDPHAGVWPQPAGVDVGLGLSDPGRDGTNPRALGKDAGDEGIQAESLALRRDRRTPGG